MSMSLQEKLERLIAERLAVRQQEKEELRARRLEDTLQFLERRMGIAPEEVQVISDDPLRVMVGGYILQPEYERGHVADVAIVLTDSQGNERHVGWATSLESLAEAIARAREKGWDSLAQQPEDSEDTPTCPFMAGQCARERCALWSGGMCSINRLALALAQHS